MPVTLRFRGPVSFACSTRVHHRDGEDQIVTSATGQPVNAQQIVVDGQQLNHLIGTLTEVIAAIPSLQEIEQGRIIIVQVC